MYLQNISVVGLETNVAVDSNVLRAPCSPFLNVYKVIKERLESWVFDDR
jgi:hypothetical protein